MVTIIQPIISGTSYDTPEDLPRRWMDRLFLNTRFYFVWGYLQVVLKARALAVKGLYDDQAWMGSCSDTFRLVEGCGGRFHLRGLENIHSSPGPVVFVSNHMSMMETFVFPCFILPYKPVTFVVKESLVTQRLFGPVMRSRNPIAVTRKNPRDDFEKVMTEGKKLLEKGTSVIIFPQNTRSVVFKPEEFNSLGIKLAKAADVPVVPVAIKTDFWGNGRLVKDAGPVHRNQPVHMIFGEPFTVLGNGKAEHQRVTEFIIENLRKAGGQVEGY
jgi:1-acyl-sn-glycerol-3-phosphate acyltransferase